jgi:DNA polymerase (family 10)
MPVHNTDIAAIFDEIADLLEIEGANPFRIRAYRNGARTVKGLGTELSEMVTNDEDLTQLSGIGKELATKIREIIDTGTVSALIKLKNRVPQALTDILKIPGLGPKRVRVFYRDLDIQSVEQLYQAAQKGVIRKLPGFGIKSEEQILKALETNRGKQKRVKLATAAEYANALIEYLQQIPGVEQVVAAGSYRRAMETVGDLDILVTGRPDCPVMDRFTAYDETATVISKGSTRSTAILHSGLQVDLRLVPQKSFGAALQYFTGSQAHNIAIRRLGRKRNLKINEYGVFRGDEYIAGETEASVYETLDLAYIPPELRENRGEIEAASERRLPNLIELDDLKGDLHVHTRASDGRNSIKEMALAAKEHNFQYLAITEHSQRLKIAGGLAASRLLQQIDEIDRLNAELSGIVLLKGIEVDILEDGRLDLPNDVLRRLDLVVGAVHSKFDLSQTQQTERILRALDHPHFSILAHPTGRLINERDPYDVDMTQIIRKAKARGCILELNARPKRLDLLDMYCQIAKSEGVLISINSDAHGIQDFYTLGFGVGQARRGWLEKDDVLNTRSLKAVRRLLRQTM